MIDLDEIEARANFDGLHMRNGLSWALTYQGAIKYLVTELRAARRVVEAARDGERALTIVFTGGSLQPNDGALSWIRETIAAYEEATK